MAIMVADNSRTFVPAPEGLHQAVCCDAIDLGVVETKFGAKPRVELRWLINELNDDGRLFMVSKKYTASLNEKASLRQDLEAWRGKKFTKPELKGFDIEQLVGVNCQVQIVHAVLDDGRTFANVKAVVPLAKGMQTMTVPADFVRKADRTIDDVDLPPARQAEDHVPF
jgi:hypothetical protein